MGTLLYLHHETIFQSIPPWTFKWINVFVSIKLLFRWRFRSVMQFANLRVCWNVLHSKVSSYARPASDYWYKCILNQWWCYIYKILSAGIFVIWWLHIPRVPLLREFLDTVKTLRIKLNFSSISRKHVRCNIYIPKCHCSFSMHSFEVIIIQLICQKYLIIIQNSKHFNLK